PVAGRTLGDETGKAGTGHDGSLRRDDRLGLERGFADLDAGKARAFLEPAFRRRRAPQRLALRVLQVPADRFEIGIAGLVVRAVDLDTVPVGVAHIEEERVG